MYFFESTKLNKVEQIINFLFRQIKFDVDWRDKVWSRGRHKTRFLTKSFRSHNRFTSFDVSKAGYHAEQAIFNEHFIFFF